MENENKKPRRLVTHGFILYEYRPDDDLYAIVGVIDETLDGGMNELTGKDIAEEDADEFVRTGKVGFKVRQAYDFKKCSRCPDLFLPQEPHHHYCRKCFNDVYHGGKPPHRCEKIKSDGLQCRHYAQHDSKFCVIHGGEKRKFEYLE
jgi:hypothetical protein